MTRPASIPPPGSPLVGLSPLLAQIAAAANRDDMPPSGTFAREGTATAPPPQVSIALFELTGPFGPGPAAAPYAYHPQPNSSWVCASDAGRVLPCHDHDNAGRKLEHAFRTKRYRHRGRNCLRLGSSKLSTFAYGWWWRQFRFTVNADRIHRQPTMVLL